MPELSDFEVATGTQFLSGSRDLTTRFGSGGRNSGKLAVLQFSALGGYNGAAEFLNITVLLNGSSLGQFSVPRWRSHASIIFQMTMADFSSNRLRSSGLNDLRFEPAYVGSTDYCWIGPAMVHFRQSA